MFEEQAKWEWVGGRTESVAAGWKVCPLPFHVICSTCTLGYLSCSFNVKQVHALQLLTAGLPLQTCQMIDNVANSTSLPVCTFIWYGESETLMASCLWCAYVAKGVAYYHEY